jgi:hypothetical protein
MFFTVVVAADMPTRACSASSAMVGARSGVNSSRAAPSSAW